MKIRSVTHNNRRKVFEVRTSARTLVFPFSKAELTPTIQDPTYLRDLLLYRLTLEAQKRVAESPLSKREIMRRLGTSAAQLYRLLDQTNYRKSVDQLLVLLQVLNCDVDLVVRTKTA